MAISSVGESFVFVSTGRGPTVSEKELLQYVQDRDWDQALLFLQQNKGSVLLSKGFVHKLLLPLWDEKNNFCNELRDAKEPSAYFEFREELEKIYFGNQSGAFCSIL